jgi:excisionase family DNA binding protein
MKLAMTKREVSDALSIGESTIDQRVKAGTFPLPFYIGRSVRFKVSDIQAWMENPPAPRKCGRKRLAI